MTMTAFDRIAEAAVQPDPGDSLLYEECWAMQGPVPEIQVTHEMRAAARRVVAGHHPASSLREASERAALIDDVYRAMAAVAPGGTKMWAEYLAAMQRVTEMEAEKIAYHAVAHKHMETIRVDRDNALKSVADLEDKLNRKSEAAMRDVDDKNETIARLKGELAEEMTSHTSDVLYYDRMVDLLEAKLAAFTGSDPAPADLPDPPRRADGTLAPQGKPFPVLKRER